MARLTAVASVSRISYPWNAALVVGRPSGIVEDTHVHLVFMW